MIKGFIPLIATYIDLLKLVEVFKLETEFKTWLTKREKNKSGYPIRLIFTLSNDFRLKNPRPFHSILSRIFINGNTIVK